MTPEQEKQRTELAKSILDNPVFQDAIKQIKQELYGEFLNSPARDSEGREKIYLMGKMFDLLLVNIKSVMETGKLNKKQ
ncbi:hypothetical protein [uncultured Mediterranean phage uvMED]|jgi:hypothetical protein|nr:hypothetical protein [uncultured Mediterranean phage uvMED]|tara:strand:+ start:222 stop:458 length:237 start_codon:yes stop_codon:yes gene_type:complete